MANKLQLSIDLAADKAISALTKLKAATKGVNDELDDTRSVGKKVADELDRATDRIVDDFKATERAVQAVGDALGPEMAASIGQSKIDAYVADLKRLGLTADDVQADADALAASLKKSSEAADQINKVDASYKDLGASIKHTGEEADNTRSVVANFAGNAAQELPGVSSALGPLNMAIGQFAEYASEGNIQLKNFVAAGAGLGVAALAMKGIQDRMAKIAEIDAFKKGQVEGYTAALREAGGEVEAIRQTLEEAGKIEFLIGDANGGFWTGGVSAVKDVTKVFAEMGVNVDTAAQLVAKGEEAIRAWGEGAVAAGADGEKVGIVMGTLIQQTEFLDTASSNLQYTQKFLASTTEDAGLKFRGLSKDVRDDRDAMDDAKRATSELNEQLEILHGTIDQKKLWNDYATALWNYNDGVGDTAAELDTLRLAAADVVVALDDIPDEQKTAIIAQINQGDIDTVNAILANYAKGINVPLRFQGQGAVGFMKNASGTPSSPGGLTLVGENGPELVNMPRGAQVFPAAQTAGMLNGGGGGVTINALTADPRLIVDAIKKYQRRGGVL